MKSYYSLKTERDSKLKDILTQFGETSCLKYSLDNHTSLILTKDERSLNSKRRFKNSPFPLLTNIEYFSSSVGDWDQDLLDYGIRSRRKSPSTGSSLGVRIHLIKLDSINSRGNRYLKRQYRSLERYRSYRNYARYWIHSWTLLQKSQVFRLACLNSWLPTWYKSLSLREVTKILNGLNPILNLHETQTLIKNVWIESPKDKWRQLGIPNKTWRLYLHSLNMFLSYLYSPSLDSSIYDGFLYNRGCKSWWETVLWSPLLTTYNWLLEVDFSSGFPNLNLHTLREALVSDGLLPSSLINLILTHLKSPLQASSTYPTLETYIEHEENLPWRESDRSVPMGLGISPILYVITLNWVFRRVKLHSKNFTSKWYADDGSLYFNTSWLLNFPIWSKKGYLWIIKELYHRRNPILSYFNNHPLFLEAGLKFDSKKSGWVRIWGIWIKGYKSLGLTLYTSLSLLSQLTLLLQSKSIPLSLKGSTRGRGSNPSKGTPSTLPSNKEFAYKSISGKEDLNLMRLISDYRPYFGLFQSQLYNSSESGNTLKTKLIYHPKSLLGILFKNKINKELPKMERLTIYNCGSKCNSILLNISNISQNSELPYLITKSLKRYNFSIQSENFTIIKVDIRNPLNQISNKENSYFTKYSELTLSNKNLQHYKQRYELQKNPKEGRVT